MQTSVVTAEWAKQMCELVESRRGYVQWQLSGFGNSAVDDVLSKARLALFRAASRGTVRTDLERAVAWAVRREMMHEREAAAERKWRLTALEPDTPGVIPAAGQYFDALGVDLRWLTPMLRPREEKLLSTLQTQHGDVEAARVELGWNPGQVVSARQMLAATAVTVMNAMDAGNLTPAILCLPEWGPWRDVVAASARRNAASTLGFSVSRWRILRAEAESLMKAARTVLFKKGATQFVEERIADHVGA